MKGNWGEGKMLTQEEGKDPRRGGRVRWLDHPKRKRDESITYSFLRMPRFKYNDQIVMHDGIVIFFLMEM